MEMIKNKWNISVGNKTLEAEQVISTIKEHLKNR